MILGFLQSGDIGLFQAWRGDELHPSVTGHQAGDTARGGRKAGAGKETDGAPVDDRAVEARDVKVSNQIIAAGAVGDPQLAGELGESGHAQIWSPLSSSASSSPASKA